MSKVVIDVEGRNADIELRAMMSRTLKAVFKTELLSVKQKKAAEHLVKQKSDTFLSFHTEHERTLTYQLAAVIKSPKLTVVFCNDMDRILSNLTAMSSYSIHSEVLFEKLPVNEKNRVYKVLFSKHIVTTFLYITPIEATTDHFKTLFNHLARKHQLAYMVIDETCHESEWLHNGKCEFMALKQFKKICPHIPWVIVMGLAGLEVVERIRSMLDIKTFAKYSAPCFTPKVTYDIVYKSSTKEFIEDFKQFAKQCMKYTKSAYYPVGRVRGLLFCENEDKADKASTALLQNGLYVSPYSNKFSEPHRFHTKLGITKGVLEVIAISTLDKLDINISDVTFIAHMCLPQTLQKYYDETGRIARMNGKQVTCRLYVRDNVISLYRSITNSSVETPEGNEKNCVANRINICCTSREVVDYCENAKCRHEEFAKYFGDQKPVCINKCDKHYSNDPMINDRMKLFGTITTLTDEVLEESLCTKRKPPINSLKTLETACHISRRIKEYEVLECKDTKTATDEVNQIMTMCKELINPSESNGTESSPSEVNTDEESTSTS